MEATAVAGDGAARKGNETSRPTSNSKPAVLSPRRKPVTSSRARPARKAVRGQAARRVVAAVAAAGDAAVLVSNSSNNSKHNRAVGRVSHPAAKSGHEDPTDGPDAKNTRRNVSSRGEARILATVVVKAEAAENPRQANVCGSSAVRKRGRSPRQSAMTGFA